MNRLGERLLDLLYPPKCAFCRRLVTDGRMLCPACEKQLPAPEKEMQSRKISGLAVCLSPQGMCGSLCTGISFRVRRPITASMPSLWQIA